MCETMQSSHRLCPAMALVRALLAPTASGTISEHLFGPVNHGQTWKGWERSGEKGLIISDNQDETRPENSKKDPR